MIQSARVIFSRLAVSLLVGSALSAYNLKNGLDSLNKARTNPKYYATMITDKYKAKTVNNIQTEWGLQFNEACPGVFDNAISFLNSATAIGALTLDLGMTYATRKHAKWLNSQNLLQHQGEGNTMPWDRIGVYTTSFLASSAENAIFNSITAKSTTEEFMIADYIIDDGLSTRGHRTNIFTSKYTHAGLGIYKGATREYFVITFAENYKCDKCGEITCDMQRDCGWLDYLVATGKSSPCLTSSTNSISVSSSNSIPTTSSSATTKSSTTSLLVAVGTSPCVFVLLMMMF